MDYSIFQVDAFTNSLFKGNPACVVPLDKWLKDDILLNIARDTTHAGFPLKSESVNASTWKIE